MNKHWITLSFLLLVSCLAFGQAPTGFSGTGYRTTVHLKWDGYTAFTPVGYNIYRSTVSNSFGAPARRVGAYNDYTDYGLNASTTYYYKVSAFDAAGNESALSNQITVSTNYNNYLKVANLDLLIPIYTGGMAANEPNDIRQELEFARQFYFRNSKGQINLKFHFMEIPGYPPPNNDGVADFGTIGTDLLNRGILDNQYDAIHVEAYQTYGYWGGAGWFGQTAGSMAHQPAWYYDPTNHYTTGDAWVFTHEFGHSLDGIIAGGSGFPDMIFNHFPWAFPLPAGIPSFDAGTDYDGMALVLRLFDHHLDYAAPWDGYFEVSDSDGDKLANNDDRLTFDEADFGSSPATDDSDLDGLTDAREFYAGIYGAANPNNPDTDGDGIPDGTDPYPISNFKSTLQKTTSAVTINGTMATGEGWQPLVSNPNFSLQPGATFSASATWDDAYLYFAFQSNMPMKYYLYMDGSGEDGIFSSPIRFESGTYPGIGEGALGDSYYESAVLVIRSDASQVVLKNGAVTGSQVATTSAGGTYTTEVRIPHNLGPGFGYTYTPPTAPVVATQSYTTGDIIGVNIVALPLANANANETDDWRGSNMISMNEPFHFYDMTLTGGGTPATYCASKGDFPWEDWVAKVKVGNFENASGKSKYSDFTGQTINLTQNVPTNIQLTTGYSYFTWNEYWRVWIDFNHDGVFSTPDEVVQQQVLTAPLAGTVTASVSGSINVPASALTGATRMRVSMKRGGYASACETFAFGEVEDYTVNISAGPTQLPNLYINAYEVIPGDGATCFTNPGQNFLVFSGLALNNGTAAAGAFGIKAWFSKDQQLSADDALWNSFQYTGVVPNNVVYWSITNPVPTSLTPGGYYVIMRVDVDNTVAESDETDNTQIMSVVIGAPDFTVSNVGGVPAQTIPGSNLNIAVEATNLVGFPLAELTGFGGTGNLVADIYLSANNQFSTIDDAQLGTVQIAYNQFSNPPLYLNGKTTVNANVAIQGGTAAGSYFIFVQLSGSCEQTILNNLSNAIPIQITTGTPGTYCPSYSNFPWEDWIAKVELGSFQNTSGKSVYSNFTSQVINVTAGQSYPIKLTTGFSYFTWNEYWKVWIDFNHDGVFSSPDEVVQMQVLSAPAAGTATASITGSVSIPAGSLTGPTRMRVSMKRGAYASACEILPFGEVEDYTVNIGTNAAKPDLTTVAWEVIPSNDNCFTPPGSPYGYLGGLVRNPSQIAVTTSFVAKAWLSKDGVIGAGDILWQTLNYTGIGSDAVAGLNINAAVPVSTPPGVYNILVMVDANNAVDESDESNNIFSAGNQLIGAADFALQNLMGVSASLPVGGNLSFSLQVKNLANFPLNELTGGLTVDVVLSTDNVLGNGNDIGFTTQTVNYSQFLAGTAIINVSGQIAGTIAPGTYFLLLKVNANCESNYWNNTLIGPSLNITGVTPGNYCASQGDFPWHEWIARVKLSTLDNQSGKSKYSDFTGLSTTLQKGQAYPVTLTAGYSYFTWNEYWRVWIDYNHDGVFSTPDEVVQQQILTAPANGTQTASVTGSINISQGALTGATRMRVSMKRGGFASSCETFANGEVEDYTINISNNLTPGDTDNRATSLSFEAVPEKTWVNLAGAYHFAEPVVQIEVEKSVDGNDYEVLETLQGKAIADNSQVVQVRDEQPNDGFNYYRMLVLFGNGDEVYSPVRVVSYDEPMDYTIFPNPATSEVFIQLTEAPEGEMQWNINDAYGRVVWTQKIAPDAQFPYRIDVKNFRDGLYYLFAIQPGKRAVGKRFVIVR